MIPDVPVTDELLHALPKTDLHCHLDGSLRLQTMLELADQQQIRLPADTVDGLARAMKIGERHGSLEEYLKGFDITLSVLQTEEALYRAAYELGIDAAAENCRLIEVRYAPVLHLQKGLKPTVVVEAVLEGLRAATRETGILAGVLVCGIRNMSPDTSLRLAELSVAYKNRGVLGFDLAGAEHGNPAKDHQEAFQLILNNNINCTVHAGEAYGPPSIAQALHYCGAHRIGHGVRLREDGDLLNYVNDHRIPIECCPSSNVQTGAVLDRRMRRRCGLARRGLPSAHARAKDARDDPRRRRRPAPRAAHPGTRQAGGAVRRTVPDHRLRALELRQFRRAADESADAVQVRLAQHAHFARLAALAHARPVRRKRARTAADRAGVVPGLGRRH